MIIERKFILAKKSYELFMSILSYGKINWFIYDFLILIEVFQFISYPYNCLYTFTDTEYEIMRIFSKVSTYFRVIA